MHLFIQSQHQIASQCQAYAPHTRLRSLCQACTPQALTFTFLCGFTLLVTSRASAFKRAHCVDTVSPLAQSWNRLAFINICKGENILNKIKIDFQTPSVGFFYVQREMFSRQQGEESGPSLHARYQLNCNVFLWRKMPAGDPSVLCGGQSAVFALLQNAFYCVLPTVCSPGFGTEFILILSA